MSKLCKKWCRHAILGCKFKVDKCFPHYLQDLPHLQERDQQSAPLKTSTFVTTYRIWQTTSTGRDNLAPPPAVALAPLLITPMVQQLATTCTSRPRPPLDPVSWPDSSLPYTLPWTRTSACSSTITCMETRSADLVSRYQADWYSIIYNLKVSSIGTFFCDMDIFIEIFHMNFNSLWIWLVCLLLICSWG